MHRARLLTALILLPLVVALILKGSALLLWGVVMLLVLLGFYEYAGMANLSRGNFLVAALGLLLIGSGLLHGVIVGALSLWISLFVLTLYFLANFQAQEFLRRWAITLAGMLYVGLGFFHLFAITTFLEGRLWLLLLLAVIFGTDTGAYYTGKAFGRHKLAPRVSPGKTVEGALGGTLLGVVLGLLFGHFGKLAPWGMLILLCFGLAVVGQIGDLLESMIKRSCGVKDSGRLLPGHGGLLDRVDALIFAAPVLYWFLVFSAR